MGPTPSARGRLFTRPQHAASTPPQYRGCSHPRMGWCGGSECHVMTPGAQSTLGLRDSWGALHARGRAGSGGAWRVGTERQLLPLALPAPSHHAASRQRKHRRESWPGAGPAVPGASSQPGAPGEPRGTRCAVRMWAAAFPDAPLLASGAGGGMRGLSSPWPSTLGVGWVPASPPRASAEQPRETPRRPLLSVESPLPSPNPHTPRHLSETTGKNGPVFQSQNQIVFQFVQLCRGAGRQEREVI